MSPELNSQTKNAFRPSFRRAAFFRVRPSAGRRRDPSSRQTPAAGLGRLQARRLRPAQELHQEERRAGQGEAENFKV